MWIYKQVPYLSKTFHKKSPRSIPLISLIVPARNEAHTIGKTIESLKSQTYLRMEIIIVDDYSTDDTVNVSKNTVGADKRFKVLDLKSIRKEKLSDWFGKSYAVQQASMQAKGEWLVFIDADINLSPQVIEKAVTFVTENKLDFLSVLPHQLCDSFWTKVVQPIPLMILLLNLFHIYNQKSKIAIAFGCFIIMKHSVFDKIGGYEQIKNKIADDAEMAKVVKRSGFKIGIVHAQDMIKIKMYEKFSDLWEGWSKNIFLGLAQNTRIQSKALKALFILAGFVGFFSIFLFPFILIGISLILCLFYRASYWEYLFIYSSLLWLFEVCAQFIIQKRYGIGSPKYALLSFLGGVIVLGIFLDTPIKILSGKGIQWKGRSYFHK